MIENADSVIRNVRNYGTKAEKSCISSLDKTATVLRAKAVDNMLTQVALPRARVKSQVKKLSRASRGNLRTGIYTEHRGVLLHNFPHQVTKAGVRVKVDPRGGFKLIPKSFIGKKALNNSGVSGYIALRNNQLIKLLMRTPSQNPAARNARINRLRKKKSWAVVPLYATSENQMLFDIRKRGDLTNILLYTMKDNFQARFRR